MRTNVPPCLWGKTVAGRPAHSRVCACANCAKWRHEQTRLHREQRNRRAVARLRTRKCTRGCGAVVAIAGPCTACMTTAELLRLRRKKVANG